MLRRVRVKSIGWLVVIAPCFLIGVAALLFGLVTYIFPGGSDEVEYEEVTRDRRTGAVVDREELTGREKNRKDGCNGIGAGIAILGIMAFAATQKAIAFVPRTVEEAAPTVTAAAPQRFGVPDEWMNEALTRLDKDGRIPFGPIWLRRDALDLPARMPITRGIEVGFVVLALFIGLLVGVVIGESAVVLAVAVPVVLALAFLAWRRHDVRTRRLVLPLETFQMSVEAGWLQVRHGKELWRSQLDAIENGEGLPAVYQALVERRTRERIGG